jgi:hypothetical protein
MKRPDQLSENERITLHFGFYFHDKINGTRDTVMLMEAILSVEHL